VESMQNANILISIISQQEINKLTPKFKKESKKPLVQNQNSINRFLYLFKKKQKRVISHQNLKLGKNGFLKLTLLNQQTKNNLTLTWRRHYKTIYSEYLKN